MLPCSPSPLLMTPLETPRLTLRPIAEREIDTLHAVFTDPFVRRYLCDDQVLSRQQTEEMLAQSQKTFAEEGFGLWWIGLKAHPTPIGFTGCGTSSRNFSRS